MNEPTEPTSWRTGRSLAIAALLAGSAAAQEPQRLMGAPVAGLTPSQASLFDQGFTAFTTPLSQADGAGPIFNETSCVACHNVPAAGGFGTRRVTRFGVAATAMSPFQPLDHLGGTLLQDQFFSATCQETVPTQANHIAQRGTPIVFGSGLLEAIPDAVIIARANNQPAHLAGRVRMVQPIEDPMGPMRPSRFGWKGGIATVHSFSLDAGLNELGLTTSFLPFENAPNGDQALLAMCDGVPDPEDVPDMAGFTLTDRFTHFQRYLAPPAQTPRSGMTGEAVFHTIGCADCHVRSYTTGTVAEAALSGREVLPYSDFLLHDMGALGDGIVDGDATETEMLTRPLWGLAQRNAYLHDGRATGGAFEDIVEDAILEHGGTALPSAQAYAALSPADKDHLFAFLGSLGRAEFDWDTNNTIDEFDWFFIEPLATGPEPMMPITADHPGAIADVDQDGDFDLVEFGKMQRVWTGQ